MLIYGIRDLRRFAAQCWPDRVGEPPMVAWPFSRNCGARRRGTAILLVAASSCARTAWPPAAPKVAVSDRRRDQYFERLDSALDA